MAKKNILGSIGAVARAGREQSGETKEAPMDVSEVKRGRSLLSAMSGQIEAIDVHLVSPKRIRLWDKHNRFYDRLDDQACADLIQGFRSVGQKMPIVARRLSEDPNYDFEVIEGARRLWTARFLALEKVKMVVVEWSDEDAFLHSDASNQYQDISDYERALDYSRALSDYYDGKQSLMAQRMGLDATVLNRYLSIAGLPEVIVKAFPDPRWIVVNHYRQLAPLLKGPGYKAVIAEAEGMAVENLGGLAAGSGAEVVKRLQKAAMEKKSGSREGKAAKRFTPIKDSVSGKTLVRYKLDDKKLSFEVPKDARPNLDAVMEAMRSVLEKHR